MTANKTYFSRHSSNISVDGALAVFDVLPTDDIALRTTDNEFTYALQYLENVTFLDYDIRYFPIYSSHCSKRSTAYYLNRKTTRYAEFPEVAGVPMNYGGGPLARYKALSEEINTEEPLLLIPTFGMTHDYEDRAKSMEFWINFEPYARNKHLNVLHDSIANLDPLDSSTINMFAGDITEVTDATAYNSARGSKTYETDPNGSTLINFKEEFILVGGRHYRFEVMLNNENPPEEGYSIAFTVRMRVGDDNGAPIYKTVDFEFVPTNHDEFNQMFAGAFGISEWVMYSTDFYVDELIGPSPSNLSFMTTGNIKISEITIVDAEQDLVETPTYKNKILEFGGPLNTSVVLSADAEFMYLEGYGEVSNVQIGEWARPMYIVCVDNNKTFDVYIDCERAMSITKSGSAYYGNVNGEWAVFYISSLFKYIDLSTVAIYGNTLGSDIQRIHHLFSYGPKYNDVITNTQHDKIYVADGSATTFSSQVLFPQVQPFSLGESHGISVGNYLSLPDYQLPTIFNGSYDDAIIENLYDDLFGVRAFILPIGSEISLLPRDVGDNITNMFISVSPSSIQSGTICRIQAKNLNHFCDIKMVPDAGGIKVTANMTYSNSDQAYVNYDQYYDRAPSYESDPNYRIKTYREVAGQADPFWEDTTISPQDFTIIINIEALRDHSDVDIASLFGDPSLEFRFVGNIPFRTIAAASPEAVVTNGIFLEGETEFPGFSMDHKTKGDDGFGNPIWEPVRHILGDAEYAIYPNEDAIDIAATGYWYVSIPLANFASYVTGQPDIDFIVYSDQGQSPQLVTSLSTDMMTYNEVESWVDADLRGEALSMGEGLGANDWDSAFVPDFTEEAYYTLDNIGKYEDLQTYAESFTPDLVYADIGLSVDTSIPSFGRFANSAIKTYVTLDSPVRWPYKNYADLNVELASSRGFIDFDTSPNSVLTTRWEIFDGFAIRIPRNINIYKYNIGFAVHISSNSLNTRRPTFRRGEFFGVSSGEYASNQISVGSGSTITIGDRNSDINIYTPYSTHLTTETVPSNYFSRELGFYPHGMSDDVNVHPVYFSLASANRIRVVSMYMMWRAETFRTNVEDELLGTMLYDDGNGDQGKIQLYARTDPAPSKKFQAANLATDLEHEIYVDGQLNGQMDVNRWHLVQIHMGPIISISERPVRFRLDNEKCIVNYVTSHTVSISPTNLYASRFGTTDLNIFSDDFSASIHYNQSAVLSLEELGSGVVGTGTDAMVTTVRRPEEVITSGVTPDLVLTGTLDG